jgi:hypothetical protein
VSWIPGWSSIAGTAWWSGFYFWVSICALIALGMAEVASHRYSDRKAELTAAEQEAIQQRHDEDMSRLHLETAQANERAAELANEAAQARAEQERLKAQLAWRTLSPQVLSQLEEPLSRHPGKINVQHVANDPESLYLAIQFANLFGKANWQVQMLSVTMMGAAVFGLFLPDSTSADTAVIRGIFQTAHVDFATGALPQATMAMGGTIQDAPILFVGSKRPL